MLLFRVAKQKNQTNSNLLGMDQGASGALALFFFRVGPPGKLQATSPQAPKLDRSQAVGYNGI